MGKFTNGPWRYENGNGLIVSASNGVVICDTIPTGDSEYESNAALIAAAPEMYELLVEVAKSESRGVDFAHSINELLAKARGEK